MNFRYEVIAEAMKIQGMSFPALAKLSGTPESTLKKLARGESEDPRLSSVQPAFKVLGLSIDRACGLAPERDMEKEAAQHNVSMATALQERLAMQEDKVSALKDTIAEQKAEIASLKATADVAEKRIVYRDRLIAVLASVLGLIIVLDLLFAGYGWFRFGLFK